MENVLVIAITVAAFWGVPIAVCLWLGRARGRRWYWFALLGLLSIVGIIIALFIPPVEVQVSVPEELREKASRVKLIWGKGPSFHHAIGPIEAEVSQPASGYDKAGPDISLVSLALQAKAAAAGANAVLEVEYFRRKPRPWSVGAGPALKARGIAASLGEEEYGRAVSNAEEIGRGLDVEDPQEALSRGLRKAGIWTIVWGALNLAFVLPVLADLKPGEGLPVILLGILLLCAWMLILGVWLLRVHKPIMLIPDGITLCAIGAVNLLLFGVVVLGILQIIWGVESIRSYGQVVRQIEAYKELRAEIDKKISAAGAGFWGGSVY